MRTALAVVLAGLVLLGQPLWADDPPVEWVDAATGHRIVRLSREPGSASLYFHQNAYTADGDKMVFATRDGLSTVHLKTHAIEQVVEGRVSSVVVGRRTRQVFYFRDGSVYATDLDTKVTREIVRRPELRAGSGLAVNADETLLAGSFAEKPGGGTSPARETPANTQVLAAPPPTRQSLEERWAARQPMALYTISIKDGSVRVFHHSTDWLNHVQFSPTDSALLMFCHEGPWHKVDRIWTIRTDGSGLRKMHTRTMDMEIAGHEFFSPDGKTIWYDLQTPRSAVFWLAGVDIATGAMRKYSVAREHWSVHYNASPDGTLFSGDGGGPRSVAAPGNGQWMYLFTPRNGALETERLVDLRKHDYQLEPNGSFTPDGRWIVFRSNMHGASHVYEVEVAGQKR